jgi:hypothetical protein
LAQDAATKLETSAQVTAIDCQPELPAHHPRWRAAVDVEIGTSAWPGPIRRAIIGENDFERRIGLGQGSGHGFTDEPLLVVRKQKKGD